MAHIAEELNAHPTLLSRLSNVFENAIRTIGRVNELERYSSMSDEELAQRGMTRQDIVRRVFRDSLDV